MLNTKIIQIIKRLDKSEVNELQKFLESPYFIKGKNLSSKLLINIFKIIKKHYPDFETNNAAIELDRRNVFSKLYAKKKYNDEIMRNNISSLGKLIEKFLIQIEFEKDKFNNKKYLLESLDSRKLDALFEQNKKQTEHLIESSEKTQLYYYNKYILRSITNNFCLFRTDLSESLDLRDELDNFFYFFICNSLDMYIQLTNESLILNKKNKLHFYDEIINHFKVNSYEDKPFILLYYYELMLTLKNEEKYFIKLIEFKKKYLNQLDRAEQGNFYLTLMNFCNEMINMGNHKYKPEYLKLFNEYLAKEFEKQSAYMPVFLFLTPVKYALSLKKYSWVEDFLNKYQNTLDPTHKSYAVNFGYAQLNYEKKEFEKALYYMLKINIEVSQEKTNLKVLLLKIYYDNGSWESALSLIDSFKHFLSKDKKLPLQNKKPIFNFLKYLNELISFKTGSSKKTSDEVQFELKSVDKIFNRQWLLEKINEL